MTTSTLASDKPGSSSLVNKCPLTIFFLLVFGFTWPFMIVDALGSHGILPFRLPDLLLLVMSYMPTLAAVIVTETMNGREGIRTLFKKLLIARVRLHWYIFAIFGFAAICAGAIELANLVGDSSNPFFPANLPQFSSLLEVVLFTTFIFTITTLVNGEELAWRGFALPRLQAKYNALTSSLILGVVWGLFHLPLFFTLNSSQAGTSFVGFLTSTISVTVIFTWMYNHTRGSVLLAYLLHGAANTWTRIFAISQIANPLVSGAMTIMTVLIALTLVLFFGAENLSKNQKRIQHFS